MNQEYQELCEELEYINWQLDIIDAAMEERMTEEQLRKAPWLGNVKPWALAPTKPQPDDDDLPEADENNW